MPTDDMARRLEEMEKKLQVLEDTEKIRECLYRNRFNADLGLSVDYANT